VNKKLSTVVFMLTLALGGCLGEDLIYEYFFPGQYGKYDILSPSYLYPKEKHEEDRAPSSPGDPGYVQYTAQHWGETVQKTPRQSPTQV
jgi:hypothetical protein